MKLLLLVAFVGFVQFCSSANTDATADSMELMKFHEQVEKLKVISGVNQTALDVLADKLWKINQGKDDIVPNVLYFYCVANGVDLSKISSLDTTNIEIIAFEYNKCTIAGGSCSSEEEDMLKSLSKEMKMDSAGEKLFSSFFLKLISMGSASKEDGQSFLTNLFTSAFHNGAGVPERNACKMMKESILPDMDCTQFANGENGPKKDDITANQ